MLTAMLRSRSTCWRMTCRNSRCSSALRSPSSMSSSEPASENSGVLNSCDALAMRSRRARSRRACAVTSRSTTMEVKSAAAADRIGGRLERGVTVGEHDHVEVGILLRIAPQLRHVGRQGGVDSLTDEALPVEKDRRRRVGDGHGALGRQTDHAFAQVVEQHLDPVALVLDLGERAAQSFGHDVEGVRELPDLVLDGLGDLCREVAAGDELRAALDALQPAGDEVRGHVAEHQADGERQQRRQQQLPLDGRHGIVNVVQRGDGEHRAHGSPAHGLGEEGNRGCGDAARGSSDGPLSDQSRANGRRQHRIVGDVRCDLVPGDEYGAQTGREERGLTVEPGRDAVERAASTASGLTMEILLSASSYRGDARR